MYKKGCALGWCACVKFKVVDSSDGQRRDDLAFYIILWYHAYKESWEPFSGEVLPLEREPDNPEDRFAVAIKKCGQVVGHIPFNLAPTGQRSLEGPQTEHLWK